VPPAAVATAVQGCAALGFRGINVTVPHKQAVMPLLAEIEEGAKAIGAVNTILFDGSAGTAVPRLIGYNTDWSGFLADLADLKVAVDGRDCLVLGAGGSARAIAYGLAQAGGKVQLLARRMEQAETLVHEMAAFLADGGLRARPLAELETIAQNCQAPLIVNTTPLGMKPRETESVWPDNLPFPDGSFVYDLVYNPQQTRLMQQAQAAGCGAANGLGMLLQQGAQAFEIWLGQSPNLAVMKRALLLPEE
jgi:shikimate dehydrogenase